MWAQSRRAGGSNECLLLRNTTDMTGPAASTQTSTVLPLPLFGRYSTAAKSGDSMRRLASNRIALLALSHLVFANASSALAQAGSTGGTIGKTDKSVSGGGERAVPEPRANPARRPGPRPGRRSVRGRPTARGRCRQHPIAFRPGRLRFRSATA